MISLPTPERMKITRDAKGRAVLGRWEGVLQILIVLSLFDFALETLPDLNGRVRLALQVLEVFSVSVFTIEYIVRLALSRPRRAYLFSFYGAIDLLSILPSLLFLGWDLRSMRALRLLRAFRILKLARYGPAIRRLRRAFELVREELVVFGAVALVVLYLAAVGIYHFENRAQPEVFCSIFHSLWWATTTLTTVGYGDAYPITAGGRIFTFFVLVIGLGIIAVPTGLIASALTRARDEEMEQTQKASPMTPRKEASQRSPAKSPVKRRNSSP